MKLILFIIIVTEFAFTGCKQKTAVDQLINNKASLPESFKLSELHQKVITSFINKKDSTMSILYGNDQASKVLSKAAQSSVSEALFTLVTWRQQDDPHWFGARIPGNLIAVETLKTYDSINNTAHYQKYTGKNLVKLADTTGRAVRISFILAQNPSIIP